MRRMLGLLMVVLIVWCGSAKAFDGAQLDRDLGLLTQQLRSNLAVPPDLGAGRAAFAEVAGLLAQGRSGAARERYAFAIANGLNSYEVWSGFTLLLRNANLYSPSPVVTAWGAVRTASDPTSRGDAYEALAQVLERRGRSGQISAILAYREAARVDPSRGALWRDAIARIEDALALTLAEWGYNRANDDGGDTAQACFTFTQPLSDRSDIRWADYVALEGGGTPVVQQSGSSQLCVLGLPYGGTVRITVRAGLPALAPSRPLGSDLERTVTIPDRPSQVAFAGSQTIIPRGTTPKLLLNTVNVEQLRVRVLRINDRNLHSFMQNGGFETRAHAYSLSRVPVDLGEELWNGTLTVEPDRNRLKPVAVPVGDMLGPLKPGIYAIQAKAIRDDGASLPPGSAAEDPDSDAEYWYWDNDVGDAQWFVITDIAISALSSTDGIDGFVRTLSDAKPVAHADLVLLARNNEILARASSDATGHVRFHSGQIAGRQGLTPIALVAYGPAGDFAALNLNRPAFDLSDRGVGGRAQPGPLDAFLYTDRGVYRPRETVNLSVLLRTDTGDAESRVPLTIDVFRPNGTLYRSLRPELTTAGSASVALRLADTAPLGTWTAVAKADPKGEGIGRQTFLVEEFIPERLRIALTPEDPVMDLETGGQIGLEARFLYGAPAAGLQSVADLRLEADPDAFPMHPGYRFGLVQETLEAIAWATDPALTDADGRATLAVVPPNQPDTTLPLRVRINAAVTEPGGRASREALSVPVRSGALHIGIKPRFSGRSVDVNAEAGFDIITIDRSGAPVAAGPLTVELVREQIAWRLVLRDGDYSYARTITDVPVERLSLSPGATGSTGFSRRLDFGRYRVEISDAATGAATSIRFSSGHAIASTDPQTPDMVEMMADKVGYAPGETARIHIRPPYAGQAQLTIATDRVLSTRALEVPAAGTVVDVPVDGGWGAGAYAVASIVRPVQDAGQSASVRAVGVAWMQLDPTLRRLGVTIDAPDIIRPRGTVPVTLRLDGVRPGTQAFVTLAAVDEGILRLTDFVTPDPVAHFMSKRRLGVDMRDDYGRIAPPVTAPDAPIRQGGDEGGATGLPTVPIRIVSLFQGPVRTADDGTVTVELDIPDFNGEVRLMAVAADATRFGSAERSMVIRDPMVAELPLPRFLAPGDMAEVTVTLHNIEGQAGRYAIRVSADRNLRFDGADQVLDLATGQRQDLRLRMVGTGVGPATVTLDVQGPDGVRIARSWDMTVRSARAPVLTTQLQRIDPNQSLRTPTTLLNRYVPGSTRVTLTHTPSPRFDVAGLASALWRWPYGCLEQVTSIGMPLLAAIETELVLGPEPPPDDAISARIESAIIRILDRQRSDGSFGLWSNFDDFATPWAQAYATEFLVRAARTGAFVPEPALRSALENLQRLVGGASGRYGADPNAQAYVHYVLTLAERARPGALRYLADTQIANLSRLARAQLGAALAAIGDQDRATRAFNQALDGSRRSAYDASDYGSDLRDAAGVYVLLAASNAVPNRVSDAVQDLMNRQIEARFTSTQEQAWLIRAASSLGVGSDRTLNLRLDGSPRSASERITVSATDDHVRRGIAVQNTGTAAIWQTLSVSGVPTDPPRAERNGLRIRRNFFALDGSPLNLDTIKQSDVFVMVLEGEAETGGPHQALVVHGLPAGWEIENPRLGATAADQLAWLGETTFTQMTEARDDRFVAAVDLNENQPKFRLAFMVRAVTPGSFELPGGSVEDMYQPRFFARQGVGRVTVAPR